MEKLKLKADKRNILGKKSRFLRRQGITPANVFGHDLESMALQCETAVLEKVVHHAGTTRLVNLTIEGESKARSVLIRDIQSDPISRALIHVDFYQVKKDEKIGAHIPIVFVGESIALKAKGRVLNQGVSSLWVESLPGDLPPQVEVDLKQLTDAKAIHVKDIDLGSKVTVRTDPDQLIAKIGEAKKIEIEEVKPKAAVEGEVVTGEAAPAEEGKPGEKKPGEKAAE